VYRSYLSHYVNFAFCRSLINEYDDDDDDDLGHLDQGFYVFY